jgi:RNA recognition motif-containing protein
LVKPNLIPEHITKGSGFLRFDEKLKDHEGDHMAVVKLFVGSLSFSVDDQMLNEAFSKAGNVVSASVIMDRDTNRSKGFAFVEMASDEEAQNAIKTLDGTDLGGRSMVVNVARPKEDRPARTNFNRSPRY